MRYSQELKYIYSLLKKLNIRYRFYWNDSRMGMQGYATQDTIHIFGKEVINVKFNKQGNWKKINKSISKQEVISTIFHEIQHILMVRQGRYKYYHGGLSISTMTPRTLALWKKEAFPAEKSADRMAKKMMKEHFPFIKYKGFYFSRQADDFMRRYLLDVTDQFNEYQELKRNK